MADIYAFSSKVLVATFTSIDYVGKYYKDGRMEIFHGDEVIDTFYWIAEYRAKYIFDYHYGDEDTDAPEKYTGPVTAVNSDD